MHICIDSKNKEISRQKSGNLQLCIKYWDVNLLEKNKQAIQRFKLTILYKKK